MPSGLPIAIDELADLEVGRRPDRERREARALDLDDREVVGLVARRDASGNSRPSLSVTVSVPLPSIT